MMSKKEVPSLQEQYTTFIKWYIENKLDKFRKKSVMLEIRNQLYSSTKKILLQYKEKNISLIPYYKGFYYSMFQKISVINSKRPVNISDKIFQCVSNIHKSEKEYRRALMWPCMSQIINFIKTKKRADHIHTLILLYGIYYAYYGSYKGKKQRHILTKLQSPSLSQVVHQQSFNYWAMRYFDMSSNSQNGILDKQANHESKQVPDQEQDEIKQDDFTESQIYSHYLPLLAKAMKKFPATAEKKRSVLKRKPRCSRSRATKRKTNSQTQISAQKKKASLIIDEETKHSNKRVMRSSSSKDSVQLLHNYVNHGKSWKKIPDWVWKLKAYPLMVEFYDGLKDDQKCIVLTKAIEISERNSKDRYTYKNHQKKSIGRAEAIKTEKCSEKKQNASNPITRPKKGIYQPENGVNAKPPVGRVPGNSLNQSNASPVETEVNNTSSAKKANYTCSNLLFFQAPEFGGTNPLSFLGLPEKELWFNR